MAELVDPLPHPVLGDRFTDAFAYAVHLHARQARKGTAIPYLTHLAQAWYFGALLDVFERRLPDSRNLPEFRRLVGEVFAG